MEAVVAPVFHRQLVAPLAVSVDETPTQTADGEAVAVTLGLGFTVTDVGAEVAEHELTSVTVTT